MSPAESTTMDPGPCEPVSRCKVFSPVACTLDLSLARLAAWRLLFGSCPEGDAETMDIGDRPRNALRVRPASRTRTFLSAPRLPSKRVDICELSELPLLADVEPVVSTKFGCASIAEISFFDSSSCSLIV